MDYYEIWFNLAPGHKDLEVIRAIENWLDYFKGRNQLEGYNITRRKLGFGPDFLPEFHVSIAFKDLAQLDEAFHRTAVRDPEVEELHREVYSRVKDFRSALYRDFPDPERSRLP